MWKPTGGDYFKNTKAWTDAATRHKWADDAQFEQFNEIFFKSSQTLTIKTVFPSFHLVSVRKYHIEKILNENNSLQKYRVADWSNKTQTTIIFTVAPLLRLSLKSVPPTVWITASMIWHFVIHIMLKQSSDRLFKGNKTCRRKLCEVCQSDERGSDEARAAEKWNILNKWSENYDS